MEQESAGGLLQCFLDLDNFQQHLSSLQGCYDGMEAQNDAMVIYEKCVLMRQNRVIVFFSLCAFYTESLCSRVVVVKSPYVVIKLIRKEYSHAVSLAGPRT